MRHLDLTRRAFVASGIGAMLASRANAATIALVSQTAVVSGTAPVTTASINTTGATLKVCVWSGVNHGTVTVSNSGGDYWQYLTIATGDGNGNVQLAYAWQHTSSGGALVNSTSETFTLNLGGSYTAYGFFCATFSGTLTTASPFDVQNATVGIGNTYPTIQPGSITPTANGDLIITVASQGSGSVTSVSVNSGFALLTSSTAAPGYAYLVQTTAAAINPTWTLSGGFHLTSAIAAFKAGTAAASRRRILN